MIQVSIQNISKTFGNFTALNPLSLDVKPGEFVSLLGPSGSGKTTLLRIIAGLIEPTTGKLEIAGQDVTRVPTRLRGIGMVFQNYALFPHLTVFENIAFGLRERKVKSDIIRETVHSLLRTIGMEEFSGRFPKQLSGGQQQRVAVARALSMNPAVLLMDEPLGALDLKLRQQMQVELKQIQQRTGITIIYVTHDQNEAFNLSDRIVVMSQGKMVQVGNPEEIYYYPQNQFVADFVGDINFIPATIIGHNNEGVDLRVWDNFLARCLPNPQADPSLYVTNKSVFCGIRPESLFVTEEPLDVNCVPARIIDKKFLGATARITLHATHSGHSLVLSSHPIAVRHIKPDMEVYVSWKTEDLIIFPDSSASMEINSTFERAIS